MRCNDIQLFLIDYLDNELDESTREQVESHLLTCEKCRQEIKELQTIQEEIATVEMEEPSPALRRGFINMLYDETGELDKKDNVKQLRGDRVVSIKLSHLIWQAAAAIIILFVGVALGSKLKFGSQPVNSPQVATLTKEVQELKQKLMVNMLDDESPSQRIEAVNYAEGFSSSNQQVVDALLNALNNDKNVNVKVAALYSLAKFTDDKRVLDSLVTSLSKQTEPLVQILLINTLTARKEIKAIKPIQDIISNSKTIKPVRDAAEKGLKEL
jgi:hypothetical protein